MFSFFKKKKEVEVKEYPFELEERIDLSELATVLDTTGVDSIYPFSWEEFPDHIQSGDNYIRVLTIIDYPKVKRGNWLSELKRKKGNITIVQTFESSNGQQMAEY